MRIKVCQIWNQSMGTGVAPIHYTVQSSNICGLVWRTLFNCFKKTWFLGGPNVLTSAIESIVAACWLWFLFQTALNPHPFPPPSIPGHKSWTQQPKSLRTDLCRASRWRRWRRPRGRRYGWAEGRDRCRGADCRTDRCPARGPRPLTGPPTPHVAAAPSQEIRLKTFRKSATPNAVNGPNWDDLHTELRGLALPGKKCAF